MADDIVARLRARDEWADEALLADAAAEIERLRGHVHPSLMYPYAPENKDAARHVQLRLITDITTKDEPGDD